MVHLPSHYGHGCWVLSDDVIAGEFAEMYTGGHEQATAPCYNCVGQSTAVHPWHAGRISDAPRLFCSLCWSSSQIDDDTPVFCPSEEELTDDHIRFAVCLLRQWSTDVFQVSRLLSISILHRLKGHRIPSPNSCRPYAAGELSAVGFWKRLIRFRRVRGRGLQPISVFWIKWWCILLDPCNLPLQFWIDGLVNWLCLSVTSSDMTFPFSPVIQWFELTQQSSSGQ